jgi:acetate kinase
MSGCVLAINAGSSSLKFSAFRLDLTLLLKGQLEGIGGRPRLIASDTGGRVLVDRRYKADEVRGHDRAIDAIASWLVHSPASGRLHAVGHRVAHGGTQFSAPILLDDHAIASLEVLIPLAPLHQPANLASIKALRSSRPALPQVACFDTAFHRSHSQIADRFALPNSFYEGGIRRYGFHGLSYEYISKKLHDVMPEIAAGKVVVAHLGSGASMCAMQGGLSVETTMAFSSLEGLPMATRSGELDPGVLIYLIREQGLSVGQVEELLYRNSGLRGLSGISGDVRELVESDEPAAKLALDYFVYHVGRQLGSLSAALQGLEAIVFTAGIGENSPTLRQRICTQAAWLGLRLDEAANLAGQLRISTEDSAVAALVIPTDEELVIAKHTIELTKQHLEATSQ